ncbi:hypothetical protein [Pectinatus sottacetonis]|uniref:hypothetical protein n=1 Tax=Pectinatus sottacetonis TaxID=1002795 RepID=UPI0018C4CF70|nr:hypothetical protein [Pectinatus sottacetonis]
MHILSIIIIAIIILALALYLAWKSIGDADIQFRIEEHSPFALEELNTQKAVFTTKFEVANEGKQCATIMDCFVRSQLPQEQFNKIRVRAKAELAGSPREDDYFEAVLIEKHKKISVIIKIELSVCGNEEENIKEVLKNVVDIPVDVVYQHTARHEASLSKKRLVLPADEINKLCGEKSC